ncbi:MAG: dehydrogenase (quinone) [Firmicutes bacterium]|nr:dehydrogenase (quinone) [Bacillota bacterium]
MDDYSEKKQACLSNLEELARIGKASLCPAQAVRISIGLATCGQAVGAMDLKERLINRQWDSTVQVVSVGCIGACYAEPLVDVRMPDGIHYFFGKMNSKMIWHIIRTAEGEVPTQYFWAIAKERQTGVVRSFADLEIVKVNLGGFDEFFLSQVKRISGRCGLIDPANLAEYVATGGYLALKKALFFLKPKDIIAFVADSGLRGRGGAGFLAASKWKITAESVDPIRFVVANADEGDPGAYMDRVLLESDPQAVLEGLILTSYAVGASRAYIFVRHEYSLAVSALRHAIECAKQAGLLGQNILGSDFSLRVTVIESAGAFVCGEETSMLQVIEGKRGTPHLRPPYPAVSGLKSHPTIINNVETLANIPWIVLNGAKEYRAVGTQQSPGTKLFCLTGDVKRTGFIEVPMGISSKIVFEKIGGTRAKKIKALQIGGPAGGILKYGDFNMDYETLASEGGCLGSGGLVVLNFRRCLVDLARHLISFMARESCGRCTICRDGLKKLESMFITLTSGKAEVKILDEIEELSHVIADLSLCGLGRTSVNSVLTTLRYFRSEYIEHTKGVCPAIFCKAMIDFEIIQSQCRDCRSCYVVCPSGAVSARSGKQRFFVDLKLCIRCWACYETCPFACIKSTSGDYV